jgi:hypothetical protein
MEPKIEFIPSAFKHGVTEADIWSAFEKFVCDRRQFYGNLGSIKYTNEVSRRTE